MLLRQALPSDERRIPIMKPKTKTSICLTAIASAFLACFLVGCATTQSAEKSPPALAANGCGDYEGNGGWGMERSPGILSGVINFGDSSAWQVEGESRVKRVTISTDDRFASYVTPHLMISGLDQDNRTNTRVYVGVCSVDGGP